MTKVAMVATHNQRIDHILGDNRQKTVKSSIPRSQVFTTLD